MAKTGRIRSRGLTHKDFVLEGIVGPERLARRDQSAGRESHFREIQRHENIGLQMEESPTERLICLNCEEEFTVVVKSSWNTKLGGWRPSYCKPCHELISVFELTDIPEHI